MKKSIILDILKAVRENQQIINVSENCENKADKVSDFYDELKEKLSPEIFKLHEKFVDALENDWYDESNFYYVQGFKLGLRIGIESMGE